MQIPLGAGLFFLPLRLEDRQLFLPVEDYNGRIVMLKQNYEELQLDYGQAGITVLFFTAMFVASPEEGNKI